MVGRGSVSLVFNGGEDVLEEKFSEIFSCNAYVDIVVYLNGNAFAVAFSNAEATGKHDVVFDIVFLDCSLEKLYDILRALKMASGADTDLYE